MKRVLISAVAAGALLGQLNAFEVYKDGDKSFGVFGVANALVGYGYNFSKSTASGAKLVRGANPSEFIYGIQGNSRIGINFTVGKVFGAALIGAGESTFYGDSVTDNNNKKWTPKAGFRQLYAGYDFGDAGKLLAGKNELITSMGGFSSSIFDIESGLQGFGGTSTSTRRFQIAYSVAGLTVSISENDISDTDTKGGNKSIPRISLGYEYKDGGLRAKVAAAYANASRKTQSDAAIVAAGVKYDLGGSYVSGLINYGFNSQLLGESKIATPSLSRGYGNVGVSGGNPTTLSGSATNTNLVGVVLEYGMNLTDDLGFKIGAGYQYATKAKNSTEAKNGGVLHSYAGFVQLPYKVGGGFSIIPQVGYMGTTQGNSTNGANNKTTYTNTGNVLAEVLFKIAF